MKAFHAWLAVRVLSIVVLIAGASLTGRALYMHAKAKLAGVLIRRAWEAGAQSSEPTAPWPWADTHPIARMNIPRLGYDEIVLESATPRTLAFGPARLLSSAQIGQAGNLVLAGHRTSWFLPLQDVRRGDEIRLEWFDRNRRGLMQRNYKVNEIRVVNPQDVTLLGPTDEDVLTLITCYPFGRSPRSPQRYIVRATPIATRIAKY